MASDSMWAGVPGSVRDIAVSAQRVIRGPSQEATPCSTKRWATCAAAAGSRSGLLVRQAISSWVRALRFCPEAVER